jgi:cardiolipin synthase (CMP-forming)
VADYRIRDLVLVPNLLSVARVPLAVAFPLVARSRALALGVLGVAALSDVLDGWVARRLGQATPMGALVDGVTDKIFAASVLGTLVASRSLSPSSAILLATRELGELPLALRIATSRPARLVDIDRRANRLGKIATVLELTTVVAVIVKARGQRVLLGATAVCGAVAAASYWAREIRAVRAARSAPSARSSSSAARASGDPGHPPPRPSPEPPVGPGPSPW